MLEDNDGRIMDMLYQAACYESNAAILKEDIEIQRIRPFMLLRPTIIRDGDKWCALYGQNIQDGVCGFGDTPSKAAIDFDINWLNQSASDLKGKS